MENHPRFPHFRCPVAAIYAALGLFAAFVFAGSPSFADATPHAMPPTPVRPAPETGATKVSMSIWLTDITKIDSIAQLFTASVVLFVRWADPRLQHNEAGVKQYALADIWHPRCLIINEAGAVERSLPETVDVAQDGSVLYRQRFVGSFSQALDLRRFPFDADTFRLHFVAVGYRPNEIEFGAEEVAVAAGLPNGVGMAPEVSLKDWRIHHLTAYPLAYRAAPGWEVAGYAFEFTAARNANHFIVKVIIPLVLIVMMSWAVFWVEPTDAGSQISVAVTAMLTLIAYRFALDAEVPKLPYVTRLDAFVLTSSLLVFFSLIEVMITTKLATCGKLLLARRIDRQSRWAFPLGFVVVTIAIFFL